MITPRYSHPCLPHTGNPAFGQPPARRRWQHVAQFVRYAFGPGAAHSVPAQRYLAFRVKAGWGRMGGRGLSIIISPIEAMDVITPTQIHGCFWEHVFLFLICCFLWVEWLNSKSTELLKFEIVLLPYPNVKSIPTSIGQVRKGQAT